MTSGLSISGIAPGRAASTPRAGSAQAGRPPRSAWESAISGKTIPRNSRPGGLEYSSISGPRTTRTCPANRPQTTTCPTSGSFTTASFSTSKSPSGSRHFAERNTADRERSPTTATSRLRRPPTAWASARPTNCCTRCTPAPLRLKRKWQCCNSRRCWRLRPRGCVARTRPRPSRPESPDASRSWNAPCRTASTPGEPWKGGAKTTVCSTGAADTPISAT